MSRRDQERLDDIQHAVTAIRAHLRRGALSDGLVFDAVRMRLLEIGEAVKVLPPEILDAEPGVDWQVVARFRDHLAHHYWGTAHATLQQVVGVEFGRLEQAVLRLRD